MSPSRTSHLPGGLWRAAYLACCLLSACGSTPEPGAVDRGRQLFESKAVSTSHLNDYTCRTCHDIVASTQASKKPGGALAGVTLRTVFWNDQEPDLLGSINACLVNFMGENQPLTATDQRARSLYAYLESFEPGDANPIPFTVVTTIDPLPRGDEQRGQLLYDETCRDCHGNMHDGRGRLSARLPILPEDTIVEHAQYTPRVQRLIFTEKIRHGLFLGYGGAMPPFSVELLSDADVSDLLEGLGITGE